MRKINIRDIVEEFYSSPNGKFGSAPNQSTTTMVKNNVASPQISGKDRAKKLIAG
jgi:hypothetical protein